MMHTIHSETREQLDVFHVSTSSYFQLEPVQQHCFLEHLHFFVNRKRWGLTEVGCGLRREMNAVLDIRISVVVHVNE